MYKLGVMRAYTEAEKRIAVIIYLMPGALCLGC